MTLLESVQMVNNMLPSLTFFNERFLIQFLIWYVTFLFIFSVSLFYTVYYLFIEIILIGVFLSFFQLDLFTAFLWLTECVIIFVSLLLLFYITVYDVANNLKIVITNNKNSIYFLTLLLMASIFTFNSEMEFYLPPLFSYPLLWEDYYEALWNDKTNDLFGLFLSFYIFNSAEFISVGYLLLIGSLICVNLNRFLKTNKTYNYKSLFDLFDIFKDTLKMLFMRKQTLTNQMMSAASTRSFNKKK